MNPQQPSDDVLRMTRRLARVMGLFSGLASNVEQLEKHLLDASSTPLLEAAEATTIDRALLIASFALRIAALHGRGHLAARIVLERQQPLPSDAVALGEALIRLRSLHRLFNQFGLSYINKQPKTS